MNLLAEYWPFVAIGIAVALLLLVLLLRPRQRVTLTDSAPIRPHMTDASPSASAAVIKARHDDPVAVPSSGDDLLKLKGVGPKLASLLNNHGIIRFDQLASLSDAQLKDLDDQLGAFRGRLSRDNVAAQADYLARGDIDGFEQRFGKL